MKCYLATAAALLLATAAQAWETNFENGWVFTNMWREPGTNITFCVSNYIPTNWYVPTVIYMTNTSITNLSGGGAALDTDREATQARLLRDLRLRSLPLPQPDWPMDGALTMSPLLLAAMLQRHARQRRDDLVRVVLESKRQQLRALVYGYEAGDRSFVAPKLKLPKDEFHLEKLRRERQVPDRYDPTMLNF